MGTKYASKQIDNAVREIVDSIRGQVDMLTVENAICDLIDDAYMEGKEEGRSDGYKEGYEEGHSDGYNEAKDE